MNYSRGLLSVQWSFKKNIEWKKKKTEINGEFFSFWSFYFVEMDKVIQLFVCFVFGEYLNSDNSLLKSKGTSRMET